MKKKYKFSDEHRKKLSESHKGKRLSVETRKKMSEAKKGITFSEEHKRRISISEKGKKLSLLTKEKISKNNGMRGMYGEKNPMFGKHLSDEAKKKISDANIGRKGINGEEHYNFGKHLSEETKRKMSEATKGKPKSEEFIIKMLGSNNPNWIDGRSFKPYCPKFNRRLKRKVRERDNFTCQLCGTKENGKSHCCHHIHYDKKNCYPDLITLCVKCNTKVNFDKEYYEQLFMNKLNERGLLYWTENYEGKTQNK